MEGRMRVSVVATGIDVDAATRPKPITLSVVGGQKSRPVEHGSHAGHGAAAVTAATPAAASASSGSSLSGQAPAGFPPSTFPATKHPVTYGQAPMIGEPYRPAPAPGAGSAAPPPAPP